MHKRSGLPAAPDFKMTSFMFRKKSKDKTPPIDENDNEDAPDRPTLYSNNPSIQNVINSKTAARTKDQSPVQSSPRPLDWESLCAALEVDPGFSVVTFRSGLDLEEDQTEALIQESVRVHLPEPPSELKTELQRHLQDVQSAVLHELLRVNPLFERDGLMKALTQNYHRALFSRMKELLQQSSSSKACFSLIHWSLTKYLSQELFLHPDLQSSDLIQNMDLVLFSDWTREAQDKLLELVKAEVSSQLDQILSSEKQHLPCDSEEQYISTYVYVIQCIDAAPSAALTCSSSLSLKLSQLCLELLLSFTHSYKQQWFDWLETLKKKKMADREMLQFFRTLKTVKELREYLTKTKRRRCEVVDIAKEVEAQLVATETFTQSVVLDVVKDFAESGLKEHFKSNRNDSCFHQNLEKLFVSEPGMSLEEHKGTMDECYKLIVHLYMKHVRRRRLSKLKKIWSPDVASSLSEDAQMIDNILYGLCPDVDDWSFPLCFIGKLLQNDLDVIKVSAVELLPEYEKRGLTVDASLLLKLFKWKGLSRGQTSEIVDILKDVEPNLDFPKQRSCVIS
ncbi:uncharacterized protein [Eucyclogobius newberryi]|uniref:uncharacterized protein n=1 Tax=Eucyclogobius newberryi TaxID=166745 RepID=UPI003B59FE42